MLAQRPNHRRGLPRTALATAAALVLTAAASACSAGSDGATPTTTTTSPPAASPPATGVPVTDPATTITVSLFQFEPVPLTVPVGTTVTFVNRDDTTHEPMSGAPGAVTNAFDVRLEGRGATGTVTLTTPGTYPFFCGIHDAMTGEIVVTG